MKQIFFITLLLSFQFSEAQENQKYQKISYFQLQDVQLLDSDFKNAMNLDKSYILSLNPDRLLSPYLKEAGLIQGTINPPTIKYCINKTNWEEAKALYKEFFEV